MLILHLLCVGGSLLVGLSELEPFLAHLPCTIWNISEEAWRDSANAAVDSILSEVRGDLGTTVASLYSRLCLL